MFFLKNKVELMRIASSGLGMGPQHAMQIAERLYIQVFFLKKYCLRKLIWEFLDFFPNFKIPGLH